MFTLFGMTIRGTCLTTALLISACSIPGIRWSDTGIAGPQLANGQATNQFRRCDVHTAHSGWASTGHFNRCDIAFRSADGTHVDAPAVQNEIGASLPRATPLRPHLRQFAGAQTGQGANVERFSLYLLAVNPVVVIGVPKSKSDPDCGAGWTMCLSVVEHYKLDHRNADRAAFAVYFNVAPPVRPGSFLLAPATKQDSTPIPTDASTHDFRIGTVAFTLLQQGGTWRLVNAVR